MTLDEKRGIIEVLLCAAGHDSVSTYDVALMLDVNYNVVAGALSASYEEIPPSSLRFSERQMIAAYLLIESSPTLIREWFH